MPRRRNNVRRRRGSNRRPRRNAMLPSFASMRNLNTSVFARLCQVGGMVSNGSGVVTQFIPMDPTSTGLNFNEWPDYAALYSQFRIIAARVTFMPVLGTFTSGDALIVGSSFSSFSAPTSYSAVAENADSVLYNLARDTSSRGIKHTLRLPRKVGFSNVGTPVPGDWAGAPGAIQMYAEGFDATVTVGSLLIECIYEFKSRS